jgi:hypothetical protein
MRPTMHQIPLTVGEREFTNAVLIAAIDIGWNEASSAAAIISAWPERADGLIDICLDEANRAAVFEIFKSRLRLEAAGVRSEWEGGWTRRKVDLRDRGARIGGSILEGRLGDFSNMFGPYEVDRDVVLAVLRHSNERAYGMPKIRLLDPSRFEQWIWFHDLDKCLFKNFYRIAYDTTNAKKRIQADVAAQAAAFALCETAGLATLRDGKRRKDGKQRVFIDWIRQLWLPPLHRRPAMTEPAAPEPAAPLSLAEDLAIQNLTTGLDEPPHAS